MPRIKRKQVVKTPPLEMAEGLRWQAWLGDTIRVMKLMPANSVDSCVVDGPYGLEFMGSDWDSFNSGAGIEKDAKSAGGYGADEPTNKNAYAAVRVRYGKLWTERPEKVKRRADGENRPFDGALPVYTAGVAYQDWNEAWAREVHRVLKPGGFILAFGGTRTFHRLACGIENSGFEIRDMLSWLYGSGFPKSSNVGRAVDMRLCTEPGRHYEVNVPKGDKFRPGDHVCCRTEEGEALEGMGTAIKPAQEPICMARKPLSEKTVADNVRKWGTGCLNIGACRIDRDASDVPGWHKSGANGTKGFQGTSTFKTRNMSAEEIAERNSGGRWPSNVIMDEEAGSILDSQSLDASRFFYCAKPSKNEKDAGLDAFAESLWVQWATANGTSGKPSSISEGRNTKRRNTHPTIKPVRLMRYLIRLVTPPGGTVLDHLAGSGTTGVAAIAEGFRVILVEGKREFFNILQARCRHAENQTKEAAGKVRVRIKRKSLC